ncbi:ARM repeat superfamily protein [Euphorbia peplus]|nr:ARM repeat superfamily protein [Euphorbia peplus]
MGQENPSQDPGCSSSSPSITQAITLVSSLITFSHGIRAFAVKWQMLRNKLEELNSSLTSIENCHSIETPVLSAVLASIIEAANGCYDLARRCVDFGYSGKLLMQSDLDLMGSKFDGLIKDLSGVCTAGVLTQGFAIVVSKPGIGSSKDDLRFYVRDLLNRMKIGDSEMKRQALVNLSDVVSEDSRYVKMISSEVNDVLHLVISFLNLNDVEIQELAAKVVSWLSGCDSCKGLLIGGGVVGALVRVLECGSELGKIEASRSLQKLTLNSDNSWSVSAHGGVTALLKTCSCVDSNGDLIGASCGVLKNLIGVDEIKRFMIEEGAVSTFIKLSRSKDESVQISSIEFLQNIAFGDESIKQLIVREGGIRAFVHVLDPKVAATYKAREVSLRAIESLCFSSMECVNTLISYGFVDHLLFFLRHGDVSFQELALKVAFRLSGTSSEEAKKAMGDAGFMSEFMKFVDAKSVEVKEMASEGLISLLSVAKNRKRFVQDDRNMGFLLQLLDQGEGNSGNNNKFLISILISLTNSNSGRRKIVNSGYLKNIEKLAEAEVFDAKRLVRKLSANKFRTMFSGLWHS